MLGTKMLKVHKIMVTLNIKYLKLWVLKMISTRECRMRILYENFVCVWECCMRKLHENVTWECYIIMFHENIA